MNELRERLKRAAAGADRLPPPTQARGGDYFPNEVMFDHRGDHFRLYDDLVAKGVVTVNFMSIRGHAYLPVTEHLVRLADRLGERLGRQVRMLSITTDPAHDSPERLAELARRHGADRPGWHFLTTIPEEVEPISRRLYHHGERGLCGPTRNGWLGHPMRLVHYGNGALGLWGAFAVDSDPDFAVQRLSWLTPQPTRADAGLRRAGPRRLGDDFAAHNREPG